MHTNGGLDDTAVLMSPARRPVDCHVSVARGSEQQQATPAGAMLQYSKLQRLSGERPAGIDKSDHYLLFSNVSFGV